MVGVPIICKQGNQGGVYVEESYKLTSSFLTNDDLQTITFALSMYDSISTKKHKDSVLNKLSLIAPDLVHLYENDAEDYLIVDLVEEKIDMTGSIYKQINHCLNEELYLAMEVSGEQLVVAPISYVLRPEGLHLYAFAQEYLLIKISTIRHSEITAIEFERNFLSYKNNNTITLK